MTELNAYHKKKKLKKTTKKKNKLKNPPIKIQIYPSKKTFKDYNHYLIDNIFTSVDLTWVRSLGRKLRT